MTTTSSLTVERGVLEVLTGQPLPEAAKRLGMPADELAEAVERYRTAGRAALDARAGDTWYQVHLEFANWNAIEQEPAARLRAGLERAQEIGLIANWWFIRKAPCWRLRCQPGNEASFEALERHLKRLVDDMKASGHIATSWTSIYEPEVAAFGGPRGMQIAHDLFHADSHAILDYLTSQNRSSSALPVGRRELSVVLCSAMMRGAGQDWFEQGDIWNRVADLRPVPPNTPLERLPDLAAKLRHLMTIDTKPGSALLNDSSDLGFASPWIDSFTKAGAAIAATTLSRGTREIVAQHIIFHWNRMGLSASTQSILTRAAREVVFPSRPPLTRREHSQSHEGLR
ncbi:thiopeptide-type bacteriocin biosynthesis protein [Kribbella deserti]|uniref:Thiopeptide-type bacteriocin biosynthesis protein n=1 Tax=Kribbella deserti TaxID=1926257 RepID=A0ABV6QUC6_9ACTN